MLTRNPHLSVQALTKYIKRKFDADPHLRNVYVKGELSNVKSHPSGHIYFTLKDEKAESNQQCSVQTHLRSNSDLKTV